MRTPETVLNGLITSQLQRNLFALRISNLFYCFVQKFCAAAIFLVCYIAVMDAFTGLLPAELWAAALIIAFCAGLVKGIVGFALPMVIVSGLGSFIAPELALAGLILPTVATNIMQAFRSGTGSAIQSVQKFRHFLAVGAVSLILGAQLVPFLPARVYLLIVGVPVVLYVITQLMGCAPKPMAQSRRTDTTFGALTGLIGGLVGVWGPPTVAYLTALNTPKVLQIQIQGVIFLSGALLLVFAHVTSGVLTWATSAFSAALILPAIVGMYFGTAIQDRIDQKSFRRATLIVLLIGGLNLVRRGVFL